MYFWITTWHCVEWEVISVSNGQWSHYWIKQSGFEPWLGTMCFVLGQDTQLSQCRPLFIQVYNWGTANLMLVGNPVMDLHPIQGRVETSLLGHLAHMQTVTCILWKYFSFPCRYYCAPKCVICWYNCCLMLVELLP